MKRIFAALSALVLCAGALAGCGGGKTPNPGSTPLGSESESKDYTVTAEAPEGWELLPGTGTLFRYRKGSGDFWVRQSPSGGSVESEIEYYKERENSGSYTFTWEDTRDAKVNGMDAKLLNYTVDTGSLKMRYDVYFIKKGAFLFTAVCLTSPVSDYAELEPEFESLLGSLKIIEK